MKRFFSQFIVVTFLVSCALATSGIAHAADAPISQFDQILGKSGLTNFAGRVHQLSSTEPGADTLTSIIFFAIDLFKYFLGGLAVIYVTVSGIKLITAEKKIDEVSEKEKDALKYIVYGLMMVMLADQLVTKVFFGQYGECVASASNIKSCAQAGSSIIKTVYSLILSLMATVAVFVLVYTGFRMVSSFGVEEEITQGKKRIAMALVGLVVSALGEFVVKGIIFRDGGTQAVDFEAIQKLVYNITTFVAGFIGVGAFLMLFYAGYLYVTAAGNEDQTGNAKKVIISALIGMVIAFAAYGIVVTLTSFTSGRTGVNLPTAIPGITAPK